MFLTLLILSNLSCKSFPTPPDLHPYDIDLEHGVCGEFKIVDKENMVFEFVKDHNISTCDGFFALSPEEMQSLKIYLRDARQTWEKKCK